MVDILIGVVLRLVQFEFFSLSVLNSVRDWASNTATLPFLLEVGGVSVRRRE